MKRNYIAVFIGLATPTLAGFSTGMQNQSISLRTKKKKINTSAIIDKEIRALSNQDQ